MTDDLDHAWVVSFSDDAHEILAICLSWENAKTAILEYARQSIEWGSDVAESDIRRAMSWVGQINMVSPSTGWWQVTSTLIARRGPMRRGR